MLAQERKGWDTAWYDREIPGQAYMAAGRFTSVENDQLVVKTLRDKPADKFSIDSETRVLKAQKELGSWGLNPGDRVNILYTEHEGETVAKEVLVGVFRFRAKITVRHNVTDEVGRTPAFDG
jgi:hypothetical protein